MRVYFSDIPATGKGNFDTLLKDVRAVVEVTEAVLNVRGGGSVFLFYLLLLLLHSSQNVYEKEVSDQGFTVKGNELDAHFRSFMRAKDISCHADYKDVVFSSSYLNFETFLNLLASTLKMLVIEQKKVVFG